MCYISFKYEIMQGHYLHVTTKSEERESTDMKHKMLNKP
jgi:hypothetical protein